MTQTDRLSVALADRYRIERELGAGGMATVYLAHDLKHDRKVALKVLKPELAAVLGAERFVVEIKTTAALQHPHILPLFDSGEADGFLYYVMPFIDGETLRAKLDRETQLGVDEAVRIASDVASALHYAHTHGVIHRDIKPENILLHDGRPMVADFGIALAVSAAAGGRMTETGLSLGTPHYMSPEQATAEKDITGRSDVYSLASVLYEMLAGNPPHTGASAQQIIMKIITETPPNVTVLRKSVPPNVAAAVSKALEKLPADRFASAKEFASALANPQYVDATSTASASTGSRHAPRWLRVWLPWAVTAAAVIAAVLAWQRSVPSTDVSRFAVAMPEGQAISNHNSSNYRLAVSPDGRSIVYAGVGVLRNARRLWIRRLDDLQATPLIGTEDATNPAFSPEGRRVAFITGATPAIKWIAVDGGTVTTVTDSLVGTGGVSWGTDGYIYFAGNGGIRRVKDTGGPSALFAAADSATRRERFQDPAALPNGRGVLFTISDPLTVGDFKVAVADARTAEQRVLVSGALGRYASGHMVYVIGDGTMMAVPFDADRLTVTGEAVKVAERVALRIGGRGDVGISENGVLAYTSSANRSLRELVWVSRTGMATAVDPSWVEPFIGRAAISPDGELVAAAVSDATGGLPTLWVKQLDRGPASPLGKIGASPPWQPRSRTILFATAAGRMALGPADGSVPPTEVGRWDISAGNPEFTPDGKSIVFGRGGDIYSTSVDGDSAVHAIVTGPANENVPSVSPDGRWLLYTSNESGRGEAYVRPFPDTKARRHKLSEGGARFPRWSRDGREVFFVGDRDDMMVVAVRAGADFGFDAARKLFEAGAYAASAFDVDTDGQRLLMSRAAGSVGERLDDLIVVQGFFAELKAKVPR